MTRHKQQQHLQSEIPQQIMGLSPLMAFAYINSPHNSLQNNQMLIIRIIFYLVDAILGAEVPSGQIGGHRQLLFIHDDSAIP